MGTTFSGKNAGILLLIIGFAIGTGTGYIIIPKPEPELIEKTVTVEKNPLEGVTVDIAYIVSSTTELETRKPLIEQIFLPDINEYASKLGYDVQFNILVDDANGQAAIFLEKVQAMHSININLLTGGPWSSHCEAALGYVNENNMLLVSNAATSPLLAFPNDNLYRLIPTDTSSAPVSAEIIKEWGIKGLVVIQRAGAYGDGLYNVFEPEWEKRGGILKERIRYAAEVLEFSSYLATANDAVKELIDEFGAEHVALLVIPQIPDMVTMLTQAKDYPYLTSVMWWSTGNTGRAQRIVDDAGEMGAKLKVLSPMMGAAGKTKFTSFVERLKDLTGYSAGFCDGTVYDSAWIVAQSVLETGSVDASDVIKVLPDVASNYFGVTGWCLLDENGDRASGMWDIWGYRQVEGKYCFDNFGEFDGQMMTLKLDLEKLAEDGWIPPGP